MQTAQTSFTRFAGFATPRARCAAMSLSVLLLALLPGSYGSALAADAKAEAAKDGKDTIATDRPDFVESADTTGQGRVQLETSLAYERSKESKSWSTPTLLRVGISEDWELRLETDGRIRQRSLDETSGTWSTSSGYGDISLGVKWHFQDDAPGKPALALLAHVDLATGSSQFKGNGARPSLRLVAEWELANEMSLGVMPGFILDKRADGKRFTAGIFGIVVGKSWTDNFRTFVELAAPQLASKENGGNVLNLDIGCAYLLSKNVQLDTAFSKGLNKNTPDWAWTVGLSVKF